MSTHVSRVVALGGLAALLAVVVASAQEREPARTAVPLAVSVFNSLEGRTTVISSRPEGAKVEKGDVVCELDVSELKDRLDAHALLVRAALSDFQAAKLARQVAELTLTQYEHGRFVVELQDAEGEIKLALSKLTLAEDRLVWARRMYMTGYVTKAEWMSEDLALQNARFSLERVEAKRQVLLRQTKDKTIKELLGQVETARARELAKEAALGRAESASRKLAGQVRRSKILAPVAGTVRYLIPFGEGAVVHDGQVLFQVLPN
jgi:HlyD family secretion protein